jgi:hypothetical protein
MDYELRTSLLCRKGRKDGDLRMARGKTGMRKKGKPKEGKKVGELGILET